jgi:glycosyltransferase involved in cell wall biosynthesis
MRMSVITACFNSADTIEDTIRSVVSQKHKDIEYIVVDGNSTDGTLDIVDRYRHRIAHVISGKDKGIYDALNKGLALASGEVVAFLNSDDIYADSNALGDIVAAFDATHPDCVYGDLEYVKRDDRTVVVRKWKAGAYSHGMFIKGWMPPHPSFFARLTCYRTYGGFDPSFHSSGDYELMLRFLHVHRLRVVYLPTVLVKMRSGGISNVTLRNRIRASAEDRRAWKVNGLRPGRLTMIRKPLSKVAQFIVK